MCTCNARGWRVGSHSVIVTIWSCVSVTVRCPPAEPGDTELPKLTSDSVLRRTGGSESSSVAGSGSPSRTRLEPRCPLRIPSECPFPLKGVGSYRARTERVRVSPGATAPATFAFHSMGGEYLTPSEYRRHVMRFHAGRTHMERTSTVAIGESIARQEGGHSSHARTESGRVVPRVGSMRRGNSYACRHRRPGATRRGARSPAWRRSPR